MRKVKITHELHEIPYLQMKLSKITVDEVLDFHKLLAKNGTVDEFLGRASHDCQIGRSSNLTKIHGDDSQIITNFQGKYLFFCCECGLGFSSEYVPDDNGSKNIIPCCPECGHAKSVTRMPKPKKSV